MNSCLSPRNGRGFQACADLEMQMLRLFFEMDAVGVAAGVAVLRAASQGESVSRPRRALLFLVADGGEGSEGWERVYQEARSEGDPEVGAAACIAAVDATLGKGRGFDAWEPWCGRLADLLVSGVDMSAQARAALHLRQGLIALLRDGDAGAAERAAAAGLSLVDAGQSLPLALALGALAGLTDCLAGHVVRADVRLSDTVFLCQCSASGVFSRALVLSTLGLVKLLMGDAETASRMLDRVSHDVAAGGLPESLLMLVEGHRLYAMTALGRGHTVQDLADRIGGRVLPARNLLLEAYRHLALGAVALRNGQALRALVHAQESLDCGRRAAAQFPVLVAALLQLQALADLHRIEDAEACLARWYPEWTRLGLQRIAAIACQEQAMLQARRGELDLARRYRSKALGLLPPGESLLPLHRSQAWLDELEGVLSAANAASPESAHVVIRTLGEFVVEVKGRRIYDRDWKGLRTKSLLMALVAEGCYKIPAVRLADRLWPDSEGDQAMQNLKVALHRLRRLGCGPGETPVNWVHVKHGQVSLAKGVCWVEGDGLSTRKETCRIAP